MFISIFLGRPGVVSSSVLFDVVPVQYVYQYYLRSSRCSMFFSII